MPDLKTRVRAAISVFRYGFPERRMQAKAAPFLWPTWRQGAPEWHIVDVESYVREGFNENTLIYSAVMYKVRAATAAPLRAYTGDPESPERLPPDAPLAKLLARPNPHQSQVEFQSQNVVYLNIAGNCYIYMDRGRAGQGLPEAMYSLRPDRVYIVPGEDGVGVMGHLYVPEGASAWRRMDRREREAALNRTHNPALLILPDDMMHVKLPNPGDPLEGMGYGLSPVAPLARSADVDNKITKFLGVFFDGGAMPSGILKYNVPLDEDTVTRIRERWAEVYGGFQNWDQIGILDNAGDYQRLGFSFAEMGFDALDERNESRILGPMGVPPILIGARAGLAHATYSNYQQARQAFWQDTMVPEIGLFECEYQYYLQDGNAFVRFDMARVPALTEVKVGLVTAWAQLVDRGVPKATAAEAVGLDLGNLPDGDVVYMPQGRVPVLDPSNQLPKPEPKPEPALPEAGQGQEAEPEQGPPPSAAQKPAAVPRRPVAETNEGAAEAEDDNREKEIDRAMLLIKAMQEAGPPPARTWTAEEKAAHWKAVDALATGYEPDLRDAARRSFETDRREVLALLNEAKQAAVRHKATVAWQDLLLKWQDYFKMAGEHWREAFVPVFHAIVTAQGERWAGELGFRFDVRSVLAEKWLREYELTFAQPIMDTTEKDLSALLETARRDGWSIPQMQKAIEALFDQYLGNADLTAEQRQWFEDRLPGYRLEQISRTESIRASNAGSLALFQNWGVERHEWVSSHDNRVRPEHEDADGQVVKVGEPFDVGGEKLRFPGDPAGSPKNTIQCR